VYDFILSPFVRGNTLFKADSVMHPSGCDCTVVSWEKGNPHFTMQFTAHLDKY